MREILKKKLIHLPLLLLVLTLCFSNTVFASTNDNKTVNVENRNYSTIAKALSIDEDSIVDIKIFNNANTQDLTNGKIKTSGLATTQSTGVQIKKKGYTSESWGISPIASDYISPGGSISHTYESTQTSSVSASISCAPLKIVSGELGYGYSTSKTVSKTISQSNNSKKGMYVDVYVIYTNQSYKVYQNSKYKGSGTLTVATGLGVVTRKVKL